MKTLHLSPAPDRWILTCLTLSLTGIIHLWGQEKIWRHYSIQNGLPTMEVWSIIQARDHTLWFASKKGIFSFDGYEFHQPTDTSAYAGNEAFFPAEDPEGRIWFSRIDKSIWYIENDTIRAWSFNHILDTIGNPFLPINQIRFDTKGDMWIHAGAKGILIVNQEGVIKTLNETNTTKLIFGLLAKDIVFGFQYESSNPRRDSTFIEFMHFSNGQTTEIVERIKIKGIPDLTYHGAVALGNGKILLKPQNQFYLWDNNRLKYLVHSDVPQSHLAASPDEQIALTCTDLSKAGVHYYSSLEKLMKKEGVNILPGVKTNYAHFDHEGGLWVSTVNEGIYYCKNPGLDVYDLTPAQLSKDVYVIACDDQNQLYAGVENNTVRFNLITQRIEEISVPAAFDTWTSLLFDPNTQKLWGGSFLHSLSNLTWKTVFLSAKESNGVNSINAKSISVSPSGDRMWMASSSGFYELDLKTFEVYHHWKDPILGDRIRTYDVVEDQLGRIWVATAKGLKIWKTSQYEEAPVTHEALRYGISELLMLDDNSILIATKGAGILIFHDLKPLIHLAEESGLTSNYVTKLKKAQGNSFAAITDAGINLIAKAQTGKWQIKRIGKAQGLPTELVHDVAFNRNDLWLGTNLGLIHWVENQKSAPIPQPKIRSIRVDHKNVNPTELGDLPYHRNNISITFHSIHFRSEGNIKYRYRLLDADTLYHLTVERTVAFPELAPGSYTLEVQSQDENGKWSEPTTLSFEIRQRWWLTWWFISLGVGVITLGALWIIRIRMNAIRAKAESVLKVKQNILAERMRISRDLHDELGSTLSGMAMYSHLVKSQIRQDQIEDASISLDRMQVSAGDMVEKLSDIVWLIRPEHDSLSKLLNKLTDYLKQLGPARGIQIHVPVENNIEDYSLPVEYRRNIYLIFKEGINNAIKYSQADDIWLSVYRHDRMLHIDLKDNGAGFDPAKVRPGNGLGNMDQRAKEIDGRLNIQSFPGGGTEIQFSVKIPQ